MFHRHKKIHKAYSIRQMSRWFWHILRRHRRQVLLNTLLGSLSVVLDFAFIIATKHTIDIATHNIEGSIRWSAAILIGILLSQLCIGFASRWVRAILGVRAQNHMQSLLFNHLLQTQWNERSRHHSGDIINRLERDVRDVVSTATETIPSIITITIRLVGAFFFLYSMDSRLAFITTLIIPLFMLLSKVYIKRMRALTREIRNTDSQIQSTLQESIQHQTVIQTLEQQPYIIRQLHGIQERLQEQVKSRTRFSSASSAVMSAGFMGCYLITFLWGASRLYEGSITYGMMIAFIQLVGQIQGPFRDISKFVPILVNAFTASERLIQLEEIPQEKRLDDTLTDASTPFGIRFEDVTYAYTQQGKNVLHHFSYDFAPKSHTAVIGETGSGKTTLIRLILSLIQPHQGHVTLYNEQSSTMCSATTRRHFTYVPQGNTLFSGSIRDNLRLGNPLATEEEMKTALESACASFVLSLPEGLDTQCNEQGVGLSEGQAQRIAIARALLRPSPILLLDEATSSLDSETEKLLWKNITEHCKDRTLIFITHRESIITPNARTLRLS